MDESKLFVAAIDFGTTYSGYAFSAKNDPTIYTCEWKRPNLTSMKTPTTVLLDSKKQIVAFGYDAENRYLNTILPEEQTDDFYYFRRFKMILHKQREKISLDTMLKDENGKAMKALDIFAIAINYLREQVLKKLQMTLKGTKEEDVQYVITVPAIWEDQSKMFMREAAEKANIKGDQLIIALEPEAASIYCQELRTDRDSKHAVTFSETIKSGTKYIVIDLGGGTADITVHERIADGTLEEVIPASGGPWGGTAIDDAYLDFLKKLFGRKVLDGLKSEDLEDYTDLIHEFEVKKRSVKPKQTDGKADTETDIVITMPVGLMDQIKEHNGSIEAAIKNSPFNKTVSVNGQKLHVKPETFRSLFDPTIDRLLKHLDALFKNPKISDLKNIIMVGGFSECELVQIAIKNKFGDRKKIIIPDEAGLAVLKGAVLFGHQPKIISKRVLKKTYGIQSWPEWDSDIHPETKKVGMDGTDRCKDVFFKFASKNEKVEVGHTQTQIFQALKPEERSLELAVYISDDENPRYITDPSCQKLGTLIVPLPPIKTGQTLEVEETMVFGETELLFRAKDLRSGKTFETQFKF